MGFEGLANSCPRRVDVLVKQGFLYPDFRNSPPI
jgi:hypothetical protein